MSNDLIFNYLMDLRKKEINPIERAKIINEYLKKENLSQRELAKLIGVSHSTLQDWCMYEKLDNKKYEELKIEKQLNDTDIYRELRNNKDKPIEEMFKMNKIQFELQKAINSLDGYKKTVDKTPKTKQLILQLQNILNIMLMYNEK
jgi:transcriptional regulator with XRE-family HTH domain